MCGYSHQHSSQNLVAGLKSYFETSHFLIFTLQDLFCKLERQVQNHKKRPKHMLRPFV